MYAQPPQTNDNRDSRPDKAHEHIRLRIPNVALRPQKRFGIRRIAERCKPFDNFVQSRNRLSHAHRQEPRPASCFDRSCAVQKFNHHKPRRDTLHQMPDFIVVVTRPAEPVLHPESKRNIRIRIMRPHQKHRHVKRYYHVKIRGQSESFVRQHKNQQPDNRRRRLKNPSEVSIFDSNNRPKRCQENKRKQEQMRFSNIIHSEKIQKLFCLRRRFVLFIKTNWHINNNRPRFNLRESPSTYYGSYIFIKTFNTRSRILY